MHVLVNHDISHCVVGKEIKQILTFNLTKRLFVKPTTFSPDQSSKDDISVPQESPKCMNQIKGLAVKRNERYALLCRPASYFKMIDLGRERGHFFINPH